MSGYNYAQYVDIMERMLTIPPRDNNFAAILPRMIDYAEQRIYREGNFLTTTTRDSTVSFTPNSRNLALPTAVHFITVEKINVVTPPATAPDAGSRIPLTQTTEEFLDNVWGSVAGAGVPSHVATLTDQTFLVGPWPDQNYTVEFIGTVRPAALSAANTTTYLTTYLPDLFQAASMIFGAAWQRDFGAQSDDPKLALSWEVTYSELFSSSNMEEQRRRWAAGAWSAMGQASGATQGRGQQQAAA